MVDLKSLSSPKVAIPVAGIVVLVVVSSLVAVFYIRNPAVAESIFGASTEETTSSSFSVKSDDSSSDHVTQSSNQMGSQLSHPMPSTTLGHQEQSSTTTSGSIPSASAATLPVTSTPGDSSTPMHAIEPVQHL